MKNSVPVESAPRILNARINQLKDWREDAREGTRKSSTRPILTSSKSRNCHAFRLFNSSLEANVRRAIDILEVDKIDEAAWKDLIAPPGAQAKAKGQKQNLSRSSGERERSEQPR